VHFTLKRPFIFLLITFPFDPP